MKAYGVVDVKPHYSRPRNKMEVNGQLHVPANTDPNTHWIDSWEDPEACLEATEKRKSLTHARN
jgi:hypothetical protein